MLSRGIFRICEDSSIMLNERWTFPVCRDVSVDREFVLQIVQCLRHDMSFCPSVKQIAKSMKALVKKSSSASTFVHLLNIVQDAHLGTAMTQACYRLIVFLSVARYGYITSAKWCGALHQDVPYIWTIFESMCTRT
jgi:hypothetical protein